MLETQGYFSEPDSPLTSRDCSSVIAFSIPHHPLTIIIAPHRLISHFSFTPLSLSPFSLLPSQIYSQLSKLYQQNGWLYIVGFRSLHTSETMCYGDFSRRRIAPVSSPRYSHASASIRDVVAGFRLPLQLRPALLRRLHTAPRRGRRLGARSDLLRAAGF